MLYTFGMCIYYIDILKVEKKIIEYIRKTKSFRQKKKTQIKSKYATQNHKQSALVQ